MISFRRAGVLHSTRTTYTAQRKALLAPPVRHRTIASFSSPATSANSPDTKSAMLQTVHRWFDSLHLPDHPLEDLVHCDAHLLDTTNQACYAGYRAMKHRMQCVHEVMPRLVEAADVADTAHHAVAAHWVAKSTTDSSDPAAGTYVFKFDKQGLIIEITSYLDAPEDEFLDA